LLRIIKFGQFSNSSFLGCHHLMFVILSEVTASQREAITQSKDPYTLHNRPPALSPEEQNPVPNPTRPQPTDDTETPAKPPSSRRAPPQTDPPLP
jgi:hypothetical protein